jgi:GNAT superfamily N-acetyltransferase
MAEAVARGAGGLAIETLSGAAILPHLDRLAALRIAVFRAFPYLYEGDAAYERDYLTTYARSETAAIVIARDGGRAVGASTCLKLEDAPAAVQAPFRAAGFDIGEVFYFGESVLRPAYRGRGAGVAFFEAREAHARAAGARIAAFCAVDRPADDPRRPEDYVPLAAFWTKRGYTRRPDLACTMTWREIGAAEETPHRLTFWLKTLA